MTRISTSLHDRLGEILFTEGIENFLSLETQKMHEQLLDIFFRNPSELHPPPVDNTLIILISILRVHMANIIANYFYIFHS